MKLILALGRPQSTFYRYGRGDHTSHELEYLNSVILPAEASLAKQTYLLQLLLQLDVQVSVPINVYYENGQYVPESRRSLIDAVQHQIEDLTKELSKPESGDKSISMIDEEELPGEPTTFAEFRKNTYIKLGKCRKEDWDKSQSNKNVMQLGAPSAGPETEALKRRALPYFEEMLALLQAAGAKPFTEIYPDATEDRGKRRAHMRNEEPARETRPQYTLFHGRPQFGTGANVLAHQLDQYDALFEACWTGDDTRIEELCLPRKGSKSGREPIQVTVSTKEFPRPPNKSNGVGYDVRHSSGDGIYNPFSVAILARHWNTARLVLAISTAQYKAPEETQKRSQLGRIISECHIYYHIDHIFKRAQISMRTTPITAKWKRAKMRTTWTLMTM